MERILATLVLFAATAAGAHEDHEHPSAATKKAAAITPAPAAPGAHDPGAHNPGDHAHDSPHGGVVATVDKDVHVEALFSETDVKVWFYDAEMKPVALPVDAKATVVVGKDVKKLDLPVMRLVDGTLGDHLNASLVTLKDQKVAMVIQATVGGKPRSARLERPAPVAARATK